MEKNLPKFNEKSIRALVASLNSKLNQNPNDSSAKLLQKIEQVVTNATEKYNEIERTFTNKDFNKAISYPLINDLANDFLQAQLTSLKVICKEKNMLNTDCKHYFESLLGALEQPFKEIIDNIHQYIDTFKMLPEHAEWKGPGLHCQQTLLVEDKVAHGKFLTVLKAIKKCVQEKDSTVGRPTLFISYAWPLPENRSTEFFVQPFLKQLCAHLRKVGIMASLDIVDNTAGGNIVQYMEEKTNSQHILLICTPSLYQKHISSRSYAVKAELAEIRNRDGRAIYPYLLAGTHWKTYPAEFSRYSTVRDFRVNSYVKNLYHLIERVLPINEKELNALSAVTDFEAAYDHFLMPMPEEMVQKMRKKQALLKESKALKTRDAYQASIDELGVREEKKNKEDMPHALDDLPKLIFEIDNMIPIEPLVRLLKDEVGNKHQVFHLTKNDIIDWLSNKKEDGQARTINLVIESIAGLVTGNKLFVVINIDNGHFTLLTFMGASEKVLALYLDSAGNFRDTNKTIKTLCEELAVTLEVLGRSYQYNNDCAIHVYEASKLLFNIQETDFNAKYLWKKIKELKLDEKEISTRKRLKFANNVKNQWESLNFSEIYSECVIKGNLSSYVGEVIDVERLTQGSDFPTLSPYDKMPIQDKKTEDQKIGLICNNASDIKRSVGKKILLKEMLEEKISDYNPNFFKRIKLKNADISHAQLDLLDFSEADFTKCIVRKTSFKRTNLHKADFTETKNLSSIKLSQATFRTLFASDSTSKNTINRAIKIKQIRKRINTVSCAIKKHTH